MTVVSAYYNGTAFVPIEPISLKKGAVVKVMVTQNEDSLIAKKLAALHRITRNLQELNETEPLPPEFDDIIAQRLDLGREINLL
jgi:predicted DNA-binding antitoxin AbrB/MazE fold protein